MGTGKRCKKILSLILSLVMAVTLLPAQMAYAEGEGAPGGEADATSPGDGMGLPAELAHFSFDSEEEIAGKVVGDATKVKIEAVDDRTALHLTAKDNGTGAFVKALDGSVLAGKKALTISYWSKQAGNEVGKWAFFVAENNMAPIGHDTNKNSYIGILDEPQNVTLERYYRGRGFHNSSSGAKNGLTKNQWRHVTVVLQERYSTVYINGEKSITMEPQPSLAKILTKDSLLKIGSCNWNRKGAASNDTVPKEDAPGEAYQGYLDDFVVYDGALDAAQVKYLHDGTTNKDDAAQALEGCSADAAHTMRVGETRELSSWVTRTSDKFGMDSKLTWQITDNDGVLEDCGNGSVKALKAGTASVSMSMRYGAKTYAIGTTAVTVKAFEPEKSFAFNNASESKLTLESGIKAVTKKASGHGLDDYTGDVAAGAGRSGQKDDYALKLSTASKYGVKITEEGKKDYTVSLWVKLDGEIATNSPIVFIGNPNPQKWWAISGNESDASKNQNKNKDECKVWTKDDGKDYYKVGTNPKNMEIIKVPPKKWTMLTLAQTGEKVSLYQDGKPVWEGYAAAAADSGLNIQLGVSYWSGDVTISGLIDDVNVYDSVLDDAQVKALYASSLSAGETADWLEIKGANDSLDCVTEDLNLPAEKDGVDITWTAKEGQQTSTVVTTEGKVTAGGGNAVTLTAACKDKQTGLAWTKEIPIKVARRITVKCLDQDKAVGNNEADLIQKEELLKEEGSEYVHTPEEVIIKDGKAYVYDKDGNKNTAGLKVTVGANAEVCVAYKAAEIKSVVTPDDAFAIEGNDPILPKTLKATVDAGGGTTVEVNAPVEWTDNYEGLEARKEPYIIKGTVGNINVSVKVTVFECDEAVEDMVSKSYNNGKDPKTKLKKGYKGLIEAEYDIVRNDSSLDSKDLAVQYYDRRAQEPDMFTQAAVSVRFGGGSFYAVGGKEDGSAGAGEYPAKADRKVAYDKTSAYHVRVQIDTTGVSVTPGTDGAAATVSGNGKFRVWVTGPDGKTQEVAPGKEIPFRVVETGIIDATAAGRLGFTVKNHKISWRSGYVTRNIETYIDDVKADDLCESTKLLPYSLMTEAEQAAYAYKADPNIMQDGQKCVLQTKESGWFDKDGSKVADDKVAEKAAAGAALTYKAYYKKGAADFAGLGDKIEKAQEQYDGLAKIYTAASLKYLDDAIKAAQAVAATEESGAPASVEAVETAIADLQAAMDRKDVALAPKDYEAMNGMLAAYYPLGKESKAKDDVGGKDGTVNGNVTFTDDGGAAFPGGSSLENYISLPDTLKVTDQMTFSFWAYCGNSADTETNATHKMHNTFCLGSGKKLGSTQGTAAPHHFSIYAGKNGTELAVDGGADAWNGVLGVTADGYRKQAWSLVTVVVDGKKAAIYQDGVKKESGEVGITLTEAWDASPAERYILLGNNCYAYNGDWDYKGNVKNLRVYNVPLVDEQVKDIFDNEVQGMLAASAGRLASDLGAQPGTGEGKYTLTVTKDTIKLPKAGAYKEAVSWKSYAADGTTESSTPINASTGEVTVPEPGAAGVAAVLRATIAISGVERTFEIACEVRNPINKESTAALRDEAKAAMEGKDKADYEAAVWDELAAAIQAYEALPEDASAQEIAAIYSRLDAALKAFVPKTAVAVTGVAISQGSQALTEGQEIGLAEGQEAMLAAAVLPQEADQSVTWESSDPAVAAVAGGRVTAVKAGTATITAASAADSTKKATVKVAVKAQEQTPPQQEAAVQDVKLNVKKLTMGVKESYTLKAAVNPVGVSNKKVEWKSDKPKVVSVKGGKLKALKTGKAKITATSQADKTKKAAITVTVKKAPDRKAKVTLNKKSVKLKVRKTFQIKAKVSSKYGSATFKYTVDKKGKKAVKVDKEGKVTAKKKGKATITVKPYNGKGKAAKLKITVK